MNLQEPLKFNSIDFTKLVYPKQKSGNNKKIIVIKLEEKNKLKNFVIQTPSLLVTNKPKLNNGHADLELALIGKEESKVKKFIKFLNDLEQSIKTDAQYNATQWFNIIENNQSINFQKIVRESEKYEQGVIKFKILKNNDFESILQQNNNKRIGINDIMEGSWCKMILEVYAVWINNNNDFGIFFRPVLVSFTQREVSNYNYKFAEDSDEDVADIPDTDIANNVFMKIDPTKQVGGNNNTTTQLEINELIENLNTESENIDSNKYSIQENANIDINKHFIQEDESTTNSIKLNLSEQYSEQDSEESSHVSFSDSTSDSEN
jgi:hypothetical protein